MGFQWINSIVCRLERRLWNYLFPASIPLKGTLQILAFKDGIYFSTYCIWVGPLTCFGQWNIGICDARRAFRSICALELAISCFSWKPTCLYVNMPWPDRHMTQWALRTTGWWGANCRVVREPTWDQQKNLPSWTQTKLQTCELHVNGWCIISHLLCFRVVCYAAVVN